MKKNADRFLTATYCDDIRQEVGDKLSLMGCYQGELVVPMAPIALPKLCVFASISTPKEKPFKSLTLRVVLEDGQELARVELSADSLAEAAQVLDETSTRKILQTAIVFSPFAIEKPTSLRLLAITEEGEISGSRLRIKIAAEQEPTGTSEGEPKPARPQAAKKPTRKKTASAVKI